MSRFFVEPDQISHDGFITITGSDVKHMREVLRMARGDTFVACDSTGTEYNCELEAFLDGNAIGHVLAQRAGDTEPLVPVTLLQGIPKGDKMELIIQKNIELGVNTVVPVMMERSVVRFKDDKEKEKKAERWNRIAMEASKQCGRLKVPQVLRPMTLREALLRLEPGGLRLVPYENEQELRLKSVLRDSRLSSVSFLIGPEGGIAEAELSALKTADFVSVSLGKRILRTETAGFAVMSAIRYELED
jgi:16S rRNA (uracil1498-N3)-methyltransferase